MLQIKNLPKRIEKALDKAEYIAEQAKECKTLEQANTFSSISLACSQLAIAFIEAYKMNDIKTEQPEENIMDIETWLKQEVGPNTTRENQLDSIFLANRQEKIDFSLEDAYKKEYDKWLNNYNKHKE